MAFSRRYYPAYPYRNFWDDLDFPSRISDQHFGMGLLEDDFLTPSIIHGLYIRPRRQLVNKPNNTGLSDIKNDDKKFLISLDVSHFEPHEIEVKTVDKSVVIHGKHAEKKDEHGFIEREFVRRYVLPEDVVPEQITSTLTPDGFLMVEAPKIAIEPPKPNERVVPVVFKEKELPKAVGKKDEESQQEMQE